MAPSEQSRYTSLQKIDITRTLTLASIGGIQPHDMTDAGRRMNRLTQDLAIPGSPIDYKLIREYYNYWRRYTSESFHTTPDRIFHSIDQARIKRVDSYLGHIVIEDK